MLRYLLAVCSILSRFETEPRDGKAASRNAGPGEWRDALAEATEASAVSQIDAKKECAG